MGGRSCAKEIAGRSGDTGSWVLEPLSTFFVLGDDDEKE